MYYYEDKRESLVIIWQKLKGWSLEKVEEDTLRCANDCRYLSHSNARIFATPMKLRCCFWPLYSKAFCVELSATRNTLPPVHTLML